MLSKLTTAGTCGFLMAAEEYVRCEYKRQLLGKKNARHFHNSMFTGYDFDQSMLRIGAMNLLLHGIENPTVHLSRLTENSARLTSGRPTP